MKPERTFKIGSVRASCFRNEYARDGGGLDVSYTVHLHKRIEERDQPGTWKSVSSFRLYELPQAALALKLAIEYVAEREAAIESTSGTKGDTSEAESS